MLNHDPVAPGFRALCSKQENFGSLRKADDGSAVEVGNPATAEFEVCRTTLLSSALKVGRGGLGCSGEVGVAVRALVMPTLHRAHTKTNTRSNKVLCCDFQTLGANKDYALPIKLFEVSDVVQLSAEHDVGAKNERHLVAVYCGKDSGFEVIHGLLNRIMEVLDVPYKVECIRTNNMCQLFRGFTLCTWAVCNARRMQRTSLVP